MFASTLEKTILEIDKTKTLLDQLPEETLFIRKDGKKGKWYSDDQGHKSFVSRNDRPHAEKLALKTYLSMKLDSLKEQMGALEILAQGQKPEEQLLSPDSPYRELLMPFSGGFASCTTQIHFCGE